MTGDIAGAGVVSLLGRSRRSQHNKWNNQNKTGHQAVLLRINERGSIRQHCGVNAFPAGFDPAEWVNLVSATARCWHGVNVYFSLMAGTKFEYVERVNHA
jgi:hypothetical protein